MIFLYGASSLTNEENISSVYTFDTKNNSWQVPQISGTSSTKRQSLSALIDNKGKMYLFGGWLIDGNYTNDMLILDTIHFTWGKGSQVNAPTPRYLYGATLLPNQHIIYLGKWFLEINTQEDYRWLFFFLHFARTV